MSEVTLGVSNTTPLLSGWYDPALVDPRGLRTTEIKGVWRWWARAVIGGSLYDECMLVGESEGGIVRRPSRDEASLINCLVGKILGLGYAGSEGSESSRFTLTVEATMLPRVERIGGIARGYQRLMLLALGRRNRNINYILPGAKFRVIVRRTRREYDDAENLALKILVLALQLTGLGKGARRGLGSLDIMSLQSVGVSIPRGLRELVDDVYESTLEIVRRYVNKCRGHVIGSCKKRALPPLPVMSKSSYEGSDVASIYIVQGPGGARVFQDVHNFFVRTTRCRVLPCGAGYEDLLRRERHAWILGLPRSQKGTGYMSFVDRRASPIMVSYHSERNVFGPGVFMTFTMSGDWPRELRWVGAERRTISLDEQRIVEATRAAFQEFSDYVRALGYSLVRVWP